VNSYFHLFEHGYHHDRVDPDVVAGSTVDVDDDLVALYFGVLLLKLITTVVCVGL